MHPGRHEMSDAPRSKISFRRFSDRTSSNVSTCAGFESPWNKGLVWGFLLVTVSLIVGGGYFSAVFLEDMDINAAVWSLLTAGIALCLSSLFILHLVKRLEYWHNIETLGGIKVFGMSMSIFSGIALGVYFILGFMKHQSLDSKGENYFRASLFSGLCFGCNLLTYFAAQWYQNIMMPRTRPPPVMPIMRSQTITA